MTDAQGPRRPGGGKAGGGKPGSGRFRSGPRSERAPGVDRRGTPGTPRTDTGRARAGQAARPLDPKAAAALWEKVSPARRVAFQILERVLGSDLHSDDLLHGPAMAGLSQPDRNLATALVLGTLRWKLALDAELTGFLARPDVRLSTAVATALELGAFQLRHMDRIPVHAAIDESVEAVRAAGQSHATGMVNAVLRKFAGQKTPAPKVFETVEQFAERLGHPEWLVERWAKTYGLAAAKAICEHDQREPEREALPSTEAELQGTDSAEEGTLLPGPLPASLQGPVIDAGSRLVAELAAALAPEHAHEGEQSGLRVWDTCAAPGGKTMVLAERLEQAEGLVAEILATDVSPRRLKAMAERMAKAGLTERVRTEVANALELPEAMGAFDLVLCDAPCSGTGTLGRNPETRMRLEPEELARQAKRQREILGAALGRLKPGGRLLYSTCSLEPEENEAVVLWASKRMSGVERVDLAPYVERVAGEAAARALVRNGCLRTLPGANFAGDGFFAAAFERVS